MRRQRPDVVVGLGGFVSGPGGLAAWLSRRPLVIHEQNAVAGFTNRVLARFARRVLTAFPGAFAADVKVTEIGNPVRREFFMAPSPAERFVGRVGPLRLLVVGGSQGATRLNAVVPEALTLLGADVPVTVRHQSGARGVDAVRDAYARGSVAANVTAFIDDIAREYAEADLVICRAGALTVSELAAIGVAAILVPFPAAVDDHQTRNAGYLVDAGAGVLMPEASLTAQTLAQKLRELGADRPRLQDMAQRARALARPQAAQDLAAICAEVGGFAAMLGAA